MSSNIIIALNCGSSSIKFAAFDAGVQPLSRTPLFSGKVHGICGPRPEFEMSGLDPETVELNDEHPNAAALALICERLAQRLQGRKLLAIVHRVVHGGQHYFKPTRVNQAVINDLRSYIPLAPLHQPFALKAMSLLLELFPGVPQVACFDTAFHATVEPIEQMFALPWSAWERGIRRYGFHGLSYDYISHILPGRHGELAHGRVIVAHLGNGASLCAMRGLKSVATTMGFSALDGLMMGTRCGSLDPGALIYLMEIEKLGLDQVAHMLYHDSGLLGVSGVSADLRELLPLEDTNACARMAVALYVRRIVREIGSLVAIMGGLDLLVFTAGIGENNAIVRERVCAGLDWLGMQLDPQANANHDTLISTSTSKIVAGVEKTNEEWMTAWYALGLI